MLISISLCTYNGSRFLREQLSSYLSQTVLPDELIVCDDVSSDETKEILEDFAGNAPFEVRNYFNERRLGSTRNFEKSISLCRGDYIFLSDQDDVWLPEKIERSIKAFDASPDALMVISNAVLVDESLVPFKKNLFDQTLPPNIRRTSAKGTIMSEALLNKNFVTGATAAFKSSARESFLPIPEDIPNMIHDAWIGLILSATGQIEIIPEPLIMYRQHAGQQLGLRLENGGMGFRSRKADYEWSVTYLENEKKRLRLLGPILNSRGLFGNDIFDRIEVMIREKDENIAHYKFRGELPGGVWIRLKAVARELRTGRYHKFSKGVISAAKDMFVPR